MKKAAIFAISILGVCLLVGCGQGISDKKQKLQEENVGKEKFRVYQDEETGKVLMKVGNQEVKLSRISRDMR